MTPTYLYIQFKIQDMEAFSDMLSVFLKPLKSMVVRRLRSTNHQRHYMAMWGKCLCHSTLAIFRSGTRVA